MLTQFQSTMASIYNGWVLFGCLIYSFGIFPSLAMKLSSVRKHSLLRTACWLAIVASLYVLLIGAYMAVDWVNPFAGKGTEVANAVHNPKGWFIVALIAVWPYFLMLIGVLIGHLAIRDLLRYRRARA